MNYRSIAVHSSLTLFVSPEKFYIQPIDYPNETLVIDRVNAEVSLEGNCQIQGNASRKLIYGIIGIIRLLSGPHLIVITKISKVGDVNGHTIIRIDETDILSFSKTTLHLTEEQTQYNRTYLNMLRTVLETPHFYFSYTYDLTHSLQRLYNAGPDFVTSPLFNRADLRFVWNQHLLKDLIREEFIRFCIPIMHGFVTINIVTLNRKIFTWILISRRCVSRAGTRLFMRGIDNDGDAANYVETEQILEYDTFKSSFVQIRGSIPLFWNQLPNLLYKPAPQLVTGANHLNGFQKHIDKLIDNDYGKIFIINLINHKGQELILEKQLTEIVRKLNNSDIMYESFDFHHECRNMRWDKLSILMDRIENAQSEFGYFFVSTDRSAPVLQDGVFRTNCVDSLDRTNVVQGLLAKRSLEHQLKKFLILLPGEKIEDHAGFEYLYRNAWADNADICSIQYAGTGALKTDFTRMGKRTPMGALKDGANSMIRYYKNNFTDGYRQDAIDLFLGNYTVDENEGKLVKCPLKDRQNWKYLTLPLFFLISIAMFFFSLLIPAEHSTETLLYLLFWLAMVSVTSLVIISFGAEFADYPKLSDVKPRKKTD